jgi:hypothetical protein
MQHVDSNFRRLKNYRCIIIYPFLPDVEKLYWLVYVYMQTIYAFYILYAAFILNITTQLKCIKTRSLVV